MTNGPLLFLSHSGVDTEGARELKRRIESSPSARQVGLKVWLDKDDLEAGAAWQRQLEQAIKDQCTAFAVYVGSKGVMNWVESEVSLGLSRATADRSFPFIPILAQKSTASALPPFASLYQAVRDPLNEPAEMEKLLKAVLGPGGPVAILEEPFVGLRAMAESDADRFFGRATEVSELIAKLAKSRLVAVVADSGSGKSSLVLAGLVPKFRGGVFADTARQEPVGRIWHVVTMRPGSAPFDNLRKAVTTAAERLSLSPKEKAELWELINPSKPQQTAYALQCNLPAETTETLLVVDQFEELFTQTPDRLRAPFIDWLLSLVAPTGVLGFRVVLTIRSDYFNLCSTHPALFDLLNQDNVNFRLKQITPEGLAAIIYEPLLMAGHKDRGEQDALLAQVRRDVSDRPGDLALIQMALFETWKQHKVDKSSLLEAYTAVGRVSGALAHAAEEVRTKRLDAKQQDLVEPVFVRLITLGDTGGATRRIASFHEFDSRRGNLVKMLSEEGCSRLLLLGADTVEICHEQLITQWPWLQSRVTESASEVRRLGRLIDKVSEWKRAEHKHGGRYLATGAELELFDFLANQHGDWLSRSETEYVIASKTARRSEEQRRVWLFRGFAAASILFAFAAVIAVILSWSSDGTVRLWNAETGQQIGPAMKHDGPVYGAVLTKDESRILSWCTTSGLGPGNTLRLWDVATGQQIAAMSHDRVVVGARLLSGDTRILSWSASPFGSPKITPEKDDSLRLWDVATGQQIGPAMRHDGWIMGAVLTNDERRILSWSGSLGSDNTLRLWDPTTGQQVGPAMKHDGPVAGAVLTKDGRRVLSWSDDHTLRLWDVATGQQIGLALKHEGRIFGAQLTKDERRILSWSEDGTLRLWNAVTGEQIGPAMRHDDSVSGAVLINEERRIMSWSDDNTLRLWDAANGHQIGPSLREDGEVGGAVLSKDETHILSWSFDETLHLWDTAAGQQIAPAMVHEGVQGAVLTKDGTHILSWGDKTLRQWDATTGQQIGPDMQHDGPVVGARLSKDERQILSWSGGLDSDNTVRRWDATTGEQIGPAMKHDGWVQGARLIRDDTRILSWSGGDYTLRLWNVTTGLQIGPAMRHDGGVSGTVLTKNQQRILSWSEDHTLRLWDIATGLQIGPAMRHDGLVSGAVLTQNEERILSWSTDHTLRLWDAATGRQIGPAMRHDGEVSGAVLTKDEQRILSWSEDHTLRLWDVATGQQIGPAMKHDGPVYGAVLTNDERRILSWSGDGTLRFWDLGWPKGNLLEIVCALLDDDAAPNASKHYGITIKDPICAPSTATLVPDWSLIERAPAQ
jgi:WD40 repeat protein